MRRICVLVHETLHCIVSLPPIARLHVDVIFAVEGGFWARLYGPCFSVPQRPVECVGSSFLFHIAHRRRPIGCLEVAFPSVPWDYNIQQYKSAIGMEYLTNHLL